MRTSFERGGNPEQMRPSESEDSTDTLSAWAMAEADRIAGTVGRPSIELVRALEVTAKDFEHEAARARNRAAEERRGAIMARDKDRMNEANARDEQARAWNEKAADLENRMKALLKAKDAEEKAVDALLGGADKPEDEIRRAA